MSTASLRLAIRCVVAIVLFAAPVAAQSITGTIQGTVVDNQNLAVPAATVTVRNIDTNVTREWSRQGRRIPLPQHAGRQLRIERRAVRVLAVRSGLTLALNQTAVVNVRFGPHRSARSSVRADAPIIHAERRGRRPLRPDARG